MTNRIEAPRAFAIVLGCGDIGSAVAVSLQAAGYAVVLVDEADPSWHRRGMAFTNAWYIGTAELENECACFCGSLKSIPSVISRNMIAATTWSWRNVAAALEPAVLVDARGEKRCGAEPLRGRVPLTIGIGSAFAEGERVDIAIEPRSPILGASHASGIVSRRAADGNAGAGDAVSVASTVEAQRRGRFMTERRIGEIVRAGQAVGGIGNEAVKAPVGGMLLGLAARGARIEPGDTLIEVDPDGVVHRCYGVGPGPRQIAEDVLSALTARLDRTRARIPRPDAWVGTTLSS
jgi:xanthine dehydrogenase accessory factor